MYTKETIGKKIFKYYVLALFFSLMPFIIKYSIYGWLSFFVAAFFPLIATIIYERRKRKRFFENLNTLEKIRKLTPSQFEEFVSEMFRRLGYKSKAVGKPSDGGIDVIAIKNGEKHYVQCKRYINSQVAIGAMRDFYGALIDKLNNSKAFFITTNIFTMEAERFAQGKPIELIDGNKLMDYVRMAGMNSTVPARARLRAHECPKCGANMVLRMARSGLNAGTMFYGCQNYPNCRFTKRVSLIQLSIL